MLCVRRNYANLKDVESGEGCVSEATNCSAKKVRPVDEVDIKSCSLMTNFAIVFM